MRGAQRAASETTRYAGGDNRLYKAAPSPDTCDCSGRKESESRGRWWRMAQKAYSLSHTKWMCKYHIVFTPKYRRKAISFTVSIGKRQNYRVGRETSQSFPISF